MEDETLATAEESGEVGTNQPTAIREVLAVHYDVVNVFRDLGVEVPVDLCFGEQEPDSLCACAMCSELSAVYRSYIRTLCDILDLSEFSVGIDASFELLVSAGSQETASRSLGKRVKTMPLAMIR